MYAYELLIQPPGNPAWESVRPGPPLELPTFEDVKRQYLHDLGREPEWDIGDGEYVGHEDEQQVEGVWFCVVIEGSETHVLPPVAAMLAFEISHGKDKE